MLSSIFDSAPRQPLFPVVLLFRWAFSPTLTPKPSSNSVSIANLIRVHVVLACAHIRTRF